MRAQACGLQVRLRGRIGTLALDLAFDLGPGIAAVLGPSGAGKTTLLRSIAGLHRLHGHVVVAGEIWQDERRFTPPHRRQVGYVFQNAAILPHLSVAQNLEYARRRAGAEPHDLRRTIGMLGLEPLLGRSPATLSGGERRRVAVARALLTRPRLVLLDEPLSGLDAGGKAALVPEICETLHALQVPTLYVTHDAGEAARVASQTLIISGGKLEASGSIPKPSLDGLNESQIRALACAALGSGVQPPSAEIAEGIWRFE